MNTKKGKAHRKPLSDKSDSTPVAVYDLPKARALLTPSRGATFALQEILANDGPIDLVSMLDALAEQSEHVRAGDLGRLEGMLVMQAHILDATFNELMRMGMRLLTTTPQYADAFMRLALKAQSQCRTSVETLAAIKNPPSVAYVRQANIAHGAQQINNGAPSEDKPRARGGNSETTQNKLLEVINGDRLDTPTASAASKGDSAMATVGPINRAENKRREKSHLP